MFALVDCNNFYVSCERVFQPQFEKHPTIILSNNDGCIIARSNEVKQIGIPMGAPAFKYKKILKQKNVKIFSSNYPLYNDMSNRIMKILSAYSPNFEIYSIDEAFIQFNGFEYFNLRQNCISIKKKIRKWTGIPVSIGVAPTKSLAKIANKIAKKNSFKTKNIYSIDNETKKNKALKCTPIENVWGIGKKYTEKLRRNNVFNAYQFIKISDNWIKKNMSISELKLKKDLEGNIHINLNKTQTSKKSISTTRSFKDNITSLSDLEERISTYTNHCSQKLRKQNSSCNSILVFISSSTHKKTIQYRNSFIIPLPYATNSSIILNKFAFKALHRIYRKNIEYKKAGVILMDLVNSNEKQLNLFNKNINNHNNLMITIDRLNKRFGNHNLKLASQDLSETWKMYQENLSKKYTTKLSEIITVR